MSAATSTSKGERTHSAIIQAARDLFIRQGYHGTSMRQIAKDAGIALGGIYNHFASKEDIFRAVFLEYHPYRDVLPALEIAQGETVEELVRNAARQMLSAVSKRTDFLNLTFIELVEFKSAHTHELFAALLPQTTSIAQRFASVQENVRPISAPMLVRTFVGTFIAYYLTDLMFKDTIPPEYQENALDNFVDIYLYGILET